jgi:hypothetical protein
MRRLRLRSVVGYYPSAPFGQPHSGRTRNMYNIIPDPRASISRNIPHCRNLIPPLASNEGHLTLSLSGLIRVFEPLFRRPFIVCPINPFFNFCAGRRRDRGESGGASSVKFFGDISSNTGGKGYIEECRVAGR